MCPKTDDDHRIDGQESPQAALGREEEALVKRTARSIYRRQIPEALKQRVSLEDLEHHGIIGLLEARNAYRPNRGVPFTAFAIKRVRGEIVSYLRRASTIHLPQLQWDKVKAYREAELALIREGRAATLENLAEKLGWESGEVARARDQIPRLTTPAGEGADDEQPPGPVLGADTPSPEQEALSGEIARLIEECMKAMENDEDRYILVARILQQTKLKVLANQIGCSMERIRQRENRARAQMRRCLESRGWHPEAGDFDT